MRSDHIRIAIGFTVVILLGAASAVVYATDEISGAPELDAEAASPLDGQSVFQAKGCTACHSREGVSGGQIGPNLTGLVDRAGERVVGLTAEQYVSQAVLDPQAYIVDGFGGIEMPTLPLSAEELEALTEFLLDAA
jgi:cytochrome c551/c552